MAAEGKKIKVLMLPWLAHGHTTPYLELASKLSTRNFHIYFCSTPVILTPIKNQKKTSIEFLDLHLPPSPELPPELHTTNGLPPQLMPALKTAFESSAPRFSDILSSVRPDLVIYDFNQPWAAETAISQGIPAVEFVIISAAMVAFGLHVMKNSGKEFPFPEIYLRDYEKKRMLQSRDGNDKMLRAMELSHKIFLLKTCREIEGRFIDHLSLTSDKKFVPVGPLVPASIDHHHDMDSVSEIESWLGEREKSSVVFTSFGSEYFLTEKERHAVSYGLELSGMSFIWALRFPAGEEISIHEALPEGFLDRVKHRGKIVEGWAPQERILKHSSTGAFLSHCGWCSVMESLIWGGGVPIVSVPMHSAQPVDARVVVAAGFGVEAVRDEEGNLRGEVIAAAIKKVMVEEGGEEIRRKSKELGGKMVAKGDEEIDDVCKELAIVCKKFC